MMAKQAIKIESTSIEKDTLEEPSYRDRGSMLSPAAWVDQIRESRGKNDTCRHMQYAATVHPCVIDGKRVLVHEKNLNKKQPAVYKQLKDFAAANGFILRADQRRNLKRVKYERRTKMMPMMVLGASIFMQNAAQAEQQNSYSEPVINTVPAIEVIDNRISAERPYLQRDGKKFIEGQYNEMDAILTVSAAIKEKGELRHISTRGLTLPYDANNKFIKRYDYQFPVELGGAYYSYYEAEGFGALSYHHGEKIVVDVLAGGGPFSSPKLWGPYDQVLHDNVQMDLMIDNDEKKSMGLLKASYTIGKTSLLPDNDYIQPDAFAWS